MNSILWCIQFPLLLFGFLHLFAISAIAPSQIKKISALADRSLASRQEKIFDRDLKFYQYCFGVYFHSKGVSATRRRACKAILVNRLRLALQKSGSIFDSALHFRCQGNAAGELQWENWRYQSVFVLKPNLELQTVDEAIAANIRQVGSKVRWDQALNLCKKMQKCEDPVQRFPSRLGKMRYCLTELQGTAQRHVFFSMLSSLFTTRPERLRINDLLEDIN